jgi:hypothetical protein
MWQSEASLGLGKQAPHQTIEVREHLPLKTDGAQQVGLPSENDFISEFRKKISVLRTARWFTPDWSPPANDIEAQIQP